MDVLCLHELCPTPDTPVPGRRSDRQFHEYCRRDRQRRKASGETPVAAAATFWRRYRVVRRKAPRAVARPTSGPVSAAA